MEIPIGTAVMCADGECAKSTHVVLDPVSRAVSHLVVRPRNGDRSPRLVPVDTVLESGPTQIRLRILRDELSSLPLFEEDQFVAATDARHPGWVMFPFATVESRSDGDGHRPARSVVRGDMALRRGATVAAIDGDVGRVNEFLVDPVDGRITHLVLTEGHPWDRRDVTIPVESVASIQRDRIELQLSRAEVGQLPALRIQRWLGGR
jgi:sporulation protein YlmC with PRC-barrel domain